MESILRNALKDGTFWQHEVWVHDLLDDTRMEDTLMATTPFWRLSQDVFGHIMEYAYHSPYNIVLALTCREFYALWCRGVVRTNPLDVVQWPEYHTLCSPEVRGEFFHSAFSQRVLLCHSPTYSWQWFHPRILRIGYALTNRISPDLHSLAQWFHAVDVCSFWQAFESVTLTAPYDLEYETREETPDFQPMLVDLMPNGYDFHDTVHFSGGVPHVESWMSRVPQEDDCGILKYYQYLFYDMYDTLRDAVDEGMATRDGKHRRCRWYYRAEDIDDNDAWARFRLPLLHPALVQSPHNHVDAIYRNETFVRLVDRNARLKLQSLPREGASSGYYMRVRVDVRYIRLHVVDYCCW